MPYNEADAERAFQRQTEMEHYHYSYAEELHSARVSRARPSVADLPAEPQPEDLPAEPQPEDLPAEPCK
jgi:hypothetical protein